MYLKPLAFLAATLFAPLPIGFEELGLVWGEAPESGGLLYPFSNKASSVLEVLMAALPAHVADIHPCVKALEIHREHDGFDVLLEESHPVASNGRAACQRISETLQQTTVYANRVVVAAGGGGAESLLTDVVPTLPVAPWCPTLGPLATTFSRKRIGRRAGWYTLAGSHLASNSGFSEEGKCCSAAMASRALWCSTLLAMRTQAKRF